MRAAVGDAPLSADQVASTTGLGSGEAAAALAELELLGLVTQAEGLFRGVVSGRG